MTRKNLSILSASIDSLPTLPIIIERVMEITADPDSSTDDLMEVIHLDQSLTTTILKMANSAFFGRSRSVSSLKQCLTILGFKEIQDLVLAKAVFNSFKNLENLNQYNLALFWEHSFLCGLAAKVIGDSADDLESDLFVAGLIHDIGKLVICSAMPTEFSDITKTTGQFNPYMFKEEKKILNLSHDELGMKILQKWLFPDDLVLGVGYHHQPNELKKESALVPAILYTADIAAHICMSDSFEQRDGIMQDPLLKDMKDVWDKNSLSFDKNNFIDFLDEVNNRKEEEAAILNALFS